MGVKPEVNRKWYRKSVMPINGKLRDAIVDTLPLDIDKATATLIVNAIFETILEGVTRDGYVTIENLGRFYKIFHQGRKVPTPIRKKNGVIVKGNTVCKWKPAHYRLAFRPCTSLKASLLDKDEK